MADFAAQNLKSLALSTRLRLTPETKVQGLGELGVNQ